VTDVKQAMSSNAPVPQIHEVQSSMPWENTPSDGYGDAWPSSQSAPSPASSLRSKTSFDRVSTNTEHAFQRFVRSRSKNNLDDTQDESQINKPTTGTSITTSQTRTDDGFRVPLPPNRHGSYVEETQDEESERASVTGNRSAQQSPSVSFRSFPSDEDSCVILTEPPAHMRKATPEVISIHSTPSQSPDLIVSSPVITQISPPTPRSPSFNRTLSQLSQTSSIHQYPHNWNSSQATQPPVDSLPDFRPMGPPSQSPIPETGTPTKFPEPLAITLEHKYPTRPLYERFPDLDQLERQQEADLQRWEETRRK
jgi:hypothetical protein